MEPFNFINFPKKSHGGKELDHWTNDFKSILSDEQICNQSDVAPSAIARYILMTGDMPFDQEVFGEQLRDTRPGAEVGPCFLGTVTI